MFSNPQKRSSNSTFLFLKRVSADFIFLKNHVKTGTYSLWLAIIQSKTAFSDLRISYQSEDFFEVRKGKKGILRVFEGFSNRRKLIIF